MGRVFSALQTLRYLRYILDGVLKPMLTLQQFVRFSICLLTITISINSFAQESAIRKPGQSNWWMKTATSPGVTDNVSPILRYDRDQFFDQTIGSATPLTPENSKNTHMSEGAVYGMPPEIPSLSPNTAIVVGGFKSYHAVLSASHRSVYTEVRLEIEQVVKQGTDVHVSSATAVTVAIPGGSVSLAENGQVISYLTDDRQFGIEPNRTYLLVLSYESLGDFFTLKKNWDVTDGVVKPNSVLEIERATKGQSRLVGLPLAAAVSELKKAVGR